MGETKYKAWDTKNHCWLDSVTIYSDGSWAGQKGQVAGYSAPDCVLMQATGFKDSTGKEEYHKDIVEDEEDGARGIIEWDKLHGSWYISWMDGDRSYKLTEVIPLRYKIIGNLYENPELVESP